MNVDHKTNLQRVRRTSLMSIDQYIQFEVLLPTVYLCIGRQIQIQQIFIGNLNGTALCKGLVPPA